MLALFEILFYNPVGLLVAVVICWPLGNAICKYANSKVLLLCDAWFLCLALFSTYAGFNSNAMLGPLIGIQFFYPAVIVLAIIYVCDVLKNRKK